MVMIMNKKLTAFLIYTAIIFSLGYYVATLNIKITIAIDEVEIVMIQDNFPERELAEIDLASDQKGLDSLIKQFAR
jgi:type IV secretory pathway component VirB8